MSEQNRLSALQMRVAGHDNIDMLLGDLERRSLQRANMRTDFGDLRYHVKPQIERDLVVAAPGGVQFCSSGANSFRERDLDIHMHILERLVPLKLTGFDLL